MTTPLPRWWVQPIEVIDGDGVGQGKYRMAAMLVQSVRTAMGLRRGPFRLCSHAHSSPETAAVCHEAWDNQLRAVGPEGGYVEGILCLVGNAVGERGRK